MVDDQAARAELRRIEDMRAATHRAARTATRRYLVAMGAGSAVVAFAGAISAMWRKPLEISLLVIAALAALLLVLERVAVRLGSVYATPSRRDTVPPVAVSVIAVGLLTAWTHGVGPAWGVLYAAVVMAVFLIAAASVRR